MTTYTYKLYKGLQRPLVFKMFKGKYIYWAGGALIGSVAIGIILSATVSSIIGLIALGGLGGGSLMWVVNQQKKGLYKKNIGRGIFMLHSIRHSSKKYTIKFIEEQNEETEAS